MDLTRDVIVTLTPPASPSDTECSHNQPLMINDGHIVGCFLNHLSVQFPGDLLRKFLVNNCQVYSLLRIYPRRTSN
jgi:hypothetical protein